MKSLMNGLLFASLLVFSVGCGKENKSGGGNRYANLYNAGLSQTSQEAMKKVQAWYQGNVEGQAITGIVNITKTKYDYSSAQDCQQKTFLGIPYTYCTYGGSSQQGTIVSQQSNVNLYLNNSAISSKGNQELNTIFSGQSGTLLNAVDLSQTATQLDFLRGDGVIVSYIIDRNYHSLLNPVKKTETSQMSKSDIIVTAQRIY